MKYTNAQTKENRIGNMRGFTLIELLVVFAVIGILSAIAIPQFFSYRMRAIDTQMKSDAKNVAIAMESYFSERFIYPTTVAEITPFGFRQTQGVTLAISVTTPSSFTVTASKPGGTQPSFTYDNSTGQTY
jgi:prepilin-type N-terminal cleavage/methylation domain-containing protein